MSLVLSIMEAELKNRVRILGRFTASDAVDRMRYAIRKAAFQAWTRQDWDFKKSSSTITTTSGTLGPYTAPTGLVRFCTVSKLAVFGFADTEILMPIYSSDSAVYFPYIKVQDGALYFISDPGDATITLNYLGAFSNDIDETSLAASLLPFDAGLNDAILELAYADIMRDLPGNLEESRERMKDGLFSVDVYWEEVTRDKYQKTVSPKGINGVSIDFYARPITILGAPLERFASEL